MSVALLRRSLQAKILLAVLVCAVIPLAAVGSWLASTASRSGELLLRSQLDSTVARAAVTAKTKFQHRQSDLSLLAGNGPVRATLTAASGDTAPTYARRAFETMPGIMSVVARDVRGRVRWTLGEHPALPEAGGTMKLGIGSPSPVMVFRVPVRDDAGTIIGELEGSVRLDALAPLIASAETTPSSFIAVHDRKAGSWLRPSELPAALLDDAHFAWKEHRWLAVRKAISDPAIDIVTAAQLDPFLDPFERTATLGALALTLAAFIVIVLTMFVTRRLTGSLGRLAVAADRVGAGDLDTRIDVSSDDEVGRVARTFNGMIDSVQRMMHELSQREAVAAMGELAATLAHQVRSPATAMRLDVQRAHDKLPPESAERALLGRALGQLDRLERAVTGTLRVARSTGGEFSEVDVHDPLRRAIAAVQREHTGRHIEFDDAHLAAGPLQVRGDAPALEQLFANVLTNAAQAAREGGSVTVFLDATHTAHLIIVVHDDGFGMTAEVLARAGEPMFSTKPEGTGLGLAIAKRIAAAHRGTLTVTSRPREGTTVQLQLPRA